MRMMLKSFAGTCDVAAGMHSSGQQADRHHGALLLYTS
jgi:hypothetical protein